MKKMQTHIVCQRSLPLIVSMIVATLVGITYLSVAKAGNSINITIKNDSQREIRHLYIAAGDPNNWGPDQLNGSAIPAGGSYTLESVSCNGSGIRVIAEDQNGCFLYDNVSCDSNAAWIITNDSTPDCGG